MHIRVAGYDGEYVIEANCFPQFSDGYGNPAWEEKGLPELSGPFATKEQAQSAIDDNREYLIWNGLTMSK